MESNAVQARESGTDDFARLTEDPAAAPHTSVTISQPAPAVAGSDQILFIGPRVSHYRDFLAGLAASAQIYGLDPDQGGLAQIAAILASRHDVAHISIIAHGNEGEIELGSTIVTQASLAASAAALKSIGAVLAPGGEIRVFGCDVGEGSTGQSFVDTLAATTGTYVAAGEGWNLDVTSPGATGASIVVTQVLSRAALDSYASPLLLNAPPIGLPISVSSFTGNTSFDVITRPRSPAAATCS